MLEKVFKIISGNKTGRRKVACRIKRTCCPPSQPFCEETSWKWRLWEELDQYQEQCDLQNFKPKAKANKQNELMGADFPLFRGPGQEWFCCDWSAHLLYRTRLPAWRIIFWFVYSCFAPGLLKSVELLSKKGSEQKPDAQVLESGREHHLTAPVMKSWVLLKNKEDGEQTNASGFAWVWLVEDFQPVLTSWAHLELLHFSCPSQPDPRHGHSSFYLFMYTFL